MATTKGKWIQEIDPDTAAVRESFSEDELALARKALASMVEINKAVEWLCSTDLECPMTDKKRAKAAVLRVLNEPV